MRVKCLAQEYNTMSLARTRTWTSQPGDEHTNHEAVVPSTLYKASAIPLILLFHVRAVDLMLFGVKHVLNIHVHVYLLCSIWLIDSAFFAL